MVTSRGFRLSTRQGEKPLSISSSAGDATFGVTPHGTCFLMKGAGHDDLVQPFSTNAPSITLDESTKQAAQEATQMVHEMNLRQMETSNKIVPWFFANMPAAYFRQVDAELRKQHLTVIVSAEELGQSDLTVKMMHHKDEDTQEITFLSVRGRHQREPRENNGNGGNGQSVYVGSLAHQLAILDAPEGMHLNRVKVFTSFDHSISVNVYTYEKEEHVLSTIGSTRDDAKAICSFIDDMRAGTVKEKEINWYAC